MPRGIHVARLAALALAGTVSAGTASGQVFDTLHSFATRPDGESPQGGLTFLGGFLYGTTAYGGAADHGTIYRIDPVTQVETVLHDFVGWSGRGDDGGTPFGELLAVDGVLYGTAAYGGTFNGGAVFRFDPATGIESLVYSFGEAGDGVHPRAALVLARGRLFGTVSEGGDLGYGAVFALDPATGRESVLHTFGGPGAGDGAYSHAPLTLANGLLYGTTPSGGAFNAGTAFSVDPRTGSEVVLHSFTGPLNLSSPDAGLVLHDGILYGTTIYGGLPGCQSGVGCGTVFGLDTATGVVFDLYRFKSPFDGVGPGGGLVYRDGRLFGTTLDGGHDGDGTIFAVNVDTGVKTTLYTFPGRSVGAFPRTLTAVGAALYGTTSEGGSGGQGIAYSFSR